MPAFRFPRARVEIEVSHLEQQGYKLHTIIADGDDFVGFADPQWKGRVCVGLPTIERPAWFAEAEGMVTR